MVQKMLAKDIITPTANAKSQNEVCEVFQQNVEVSFSTLRPKQAISCTNLMSKMQDLYPVIATRFFEQVHTKILFKCSPVGYFLQKYLTNAAVTLCTL